MKGKVNTMRKNDGTLSALAIVTNQPTLQDLINEKGRRFEASSTRAGKNVKQENDENKIYLHTSKKEIE